MTLFGLDLASALVGCLLLATIALVGLIVARPGLTAARGGKVLAFFAFFALPAAALWSGFALHFEHSKSTKFCLSCHVMEPYGESLRIDDAEFLPAAHFQNRRIDRDHACYTCHTDYSMFGGVRAKLGGLKHVWVYYTRQTPEKIELYRPYRNRECLHCHGGARNYIEAHGEDLPALESNEMSCLDCHDQLHAVEKVAEMPKWTEEARP